MLNLNIQDYNFACGSVCMGVKLGLDIKGGTQTEGV
jgi:hypothetical protein